MAQDSANLDARLLLLAGGNLLAALIQDRVAFVILKPDLLVAARPTRYKPVHRYGWAVLDIPDLHFDAVIRERLTDDFGGFVDLLFGNAAVFHALQHLNRRLRPLFAALAQHRL